MAIAIDAASSSPVGVGSQSWSHTCTGSNLILYVGVWNQNTSTTNITGVTYNGVAMTKVTAIAYTGVAGCTYLYRLVAPATGSNIIAVTASGNFTVAAAASYTGAAQTGQPDATAVTATTGAGVATGLTTNITTVNNNAWVISAFGTEGNSSATSGTVKRLTNASNTALSIFDTNAPVTPAGSTSQVISSGGSVQSSMISESFLPFAAAASNSNFFLFAMR